MAFQRDMHPNMCINSDGVQLYILKKYISAVGREAVMQLTEPTSEGSGAHLESLLYLRVYKALEGGWCILEVQNPDVLHCI